MIKENTLGYIYGLQEKKGILKKTNGINDNTVNTFISKFLSNKQHNKVAKYLQHT